MCLLERAAWYVALIHVHSLRMYLRHEASGAFLVLHVLA